MTSKKTATGRSKPAAAAASSKTADRTKTAQYYARRPFTYGGQPFDREQVLQLTGQPNDERLVRLGYLAELDRAPVACNRCAATFRTTGALEIHGTKRHEAKPSPRPTMAPRQPGESDYDYDRREQAFRQQVLEAERDDDAREEGRLEREAPLNWENTQATREAEL
jgi:hypothetical protein